MYIKINCPYISKTLGVGQKQSRRSSINDQWHFYAKYDKKASTKTFFLNPRGEQNNP